MRTLLNKLYLISGLLSGLCIVIMVLLILSQIIGRFFGFIIPSVDDFSGYSLAAATFFGLAYTFKNGGHIRVTLAIKALPPKLRKFQEIAILTLAVVLTLYMAFYLVHLSWESYIYEDVSYGYIPVPLWLPQLPVAIGMVMFTIAVIDDWVCLIMGGTPGYILHEDDELKVSLESDQTAEKGDH